MAEPASPTPSYSRPAETAEFFEWSVGDLLRQVTGEEPERTALIVPSSAEGGTERRWSYRELLAESERSAQALLRHFKPGDRVATLAGASPEILLLQMAAALAGVVLVTLNPASRTAELNYLLSQSEARGLFLDRVYRKTNNEAALRELQPHLPCLEKIVYMDEWASFVVGGEGGEGGKGDRGREGDARDAGGPLPHVAGSAPVLILFTSGTTGKPKGVVLRHRGIVNNARLSTARIALAPGSVWLNLLPMFHVGGSVTIALGCFSNAGTQVMLPEFNAEAALDALQRYRVKMTMAVPTMLHAMLRSEHFDATDLSALEVVVTGGTVVAPALVREVEKRFGVQVMVLFGQTEAGGCMCLTRRGDSEDRVTNSVGVPLPLSEAKIIDRDGSVMPLGEVGEICVRTQCAMAEYFRMPAQSAEALDAEGWVHTGDLGTMRTDGYIQIAGRLKDMIIRGGENIYPREIEDRLAAHPCVAQAAVFGVPDETWGEQVAAAVILKPGMVVDAETLTSSLQEHIARHKVPKIWRFVGELPLNASGKVQKFVLREQYLASPEQS